MVRLIALSNGQNQPVIRLGKKGQPYRQLNPKMVVAIRAQSLTPRAGTIAYLPCKQPTRKWLCYTGPIAYPKSWYDRLLCPTSGAIYKNNSVAYPKSGTIDYLAQQAGIYKYTTRSPTPRAVRSTTSPQEQHNHSNNSIAYPKSGTIDYFAPRAAQSLQQLGRLPQERND